MYLKQLQEEADDLPNNTRQQKANKERAEAKASEYAQEAFSFVGEETKPLHSKVKHGAYCMQCDPPPDFQNSGLTHIKCALGDYEHCNNYSRPKA